VISHLEARTYDQPPPGFSCKITPMSQDYAEQILTRLDELTHVVRAHAHEADQRTQMSEPVLRLMNELRLFRLWIPRRFGGLELELPQTLRIYEAVARADGSVGWAVMIGAGGGLFAAYLDPAAADEIFTPHNAVIAGSGVPDGRAERVVGGYRVSGHWRYASGARFATTFTANCTVTNNGQEICGADGQSLIRAMSFAPSDVTILPAWDTSGMRGTGSHDFQVQNVFVPQQRTFSVFTDGARESGPLYRLPFTVLTELPIAAVAVGIARHALDSFAELARRKRPQASGTPFADDPLARIQYADSNARWHLAQAGLTALAVRTWHVAVAARPLTPHELAEITATCAVCVAQLGVAIGELVRLAGMSAILYDGELARAWRDLQALAAHSAVSARQLLPAGGVLLETARP
jgi:indole-3-acetate monooxygenase